VSAAVTPLAEALIARIERDGPIGIAAYIEACLHDPEHGYYRRRSAIGRDGDFITAPEISQIFGELIGLWCAVVWQQMGAPPRLRLVELGPGRGTLMRDALRAARALPGFRAALSIELVETNSVLAAAQRATLASESVPVSWSGELRPQPGPAILIANEFLDTLPIDQWIWQSGAWHPRRVGVSGGRLAFTLGPADAELEVPAGIACTAEGDVLEHRRTAFSHLAATLAGFGESFAALFIDYGHARTALGDTLQAVRNHRYDDPLAAPGQADLTAQVDFASFADVMIAHGLACDGPVAQAEFLGSLGIAERASRLMAANADAAGGIETAVARLMAPVGMGTRFKVIGLRRPELPPLPGLAVDTRAAPP
jgi:SAM-dependent MidA family methyltransferase